MSAPPTSSGEKIVDKRQLVEHLAAGSKPRERWLMGTEHEKFGFRRDTLKPLAYEGPGGIRAILDGLSSRFGWTPVLEDGKPIALTRERASITLEPGGQFELSGAPLADVHVTAAETAQHLDEVRAVAGPLGSAFLGAGFAPTWTRADMDWMPKGRYRIMRRQMERKGKLGVDMMLRTCTVQTNLDFADEADMVKKFRVSLALQPIATALFANSPFVEGKPSGLRSMRSNVWTDTDPDRCGMLPFVFEPGFGFERYVDYLLDVPMYFVYREGRYIDAAGQSFRDFLAGKLPALPGETPGMGDFSDHLTTAFPEVRLKRFLEMRGADCGPKEMLDALPAYWVGLLYDQSALDAAWDLVKGWSIADMAQLRDGAPKAALAATVKGRSVRDVARDTLRIARAGLAARRALDASGADETRYLDPLDRIVDSGQTLADRRLADYAGAWKQDARRWFEAAF